MKRTPLKTTGTKKTAPKKTLTKKADYRKWVDLLSHTYGDGPVEEALKNAGVTKKLSMPRDGTPLLVDVGGMTLTFDNADVRTDIRPIGPGKGMLAAVAIHLGDYAGPLPSNIKANMTQEALLALLGPPLEPKEAWGGRGWRHEWRVSDRLHLVAHGSRDGTSIRSLVLMIPDEPLD